MKQITTKFHNHDDSHPMAAWLAASPMPKSPNRNDIVDGTVVARDRSGFFVNIGAKSDAYVKDDECENLAVGDTTRFLVISVAESDEEFQLSQNRVAAIEKRNNAWATLGTLLTSQAVATAHVTELAHNKQTSSVSGVRALIEGITSFIPRRQIAVFGDLSALIGTDIPVKVMTVDRAEGDVILSHSLAMQETQRAYLSSLNPGDKVHGKISHILNNEKGALVDLGATVGLVPRDELSDKRSLKTADIVQVGQELTFVVQKTNLDTLQVRLSLKLALQDDLFGNLHEGDIVSGVVASKTTWGVFIRLNNCLDGLVHETELLGADGSENKSFGPRETLALGAEVRVRVLGVDTMRRRVSLSRIGLPVAS